MEQEIKIICEKLVISLNLIMSPLVDQKQRQEAYKVCEDFKDNSPLGPQCGLYLSERTNSPIIRHFGLQIIEHCIRFRWNVMTQDEKLFIKNSAVQLLASGTESVLDEQAHIKDALSRIIVEMIKREWPQQWSTLLEELNKICSIGETQTELVLLIFLRLAEDIVTFQNVQNQRRREIHQAITSNLKDLFSFFLSTLKDQFTKYNQAKSCSEDSYKLQAMIHCHVANTVLITLAGYVEWIPMVHITADNELLLQVLCALLNDNILQLSAAECLLLIVGRKGKTEERKPILQLFREDSMSVIFSAVCSAGSLSLKEQNFVFLKKLCQVLTSLGLQLSALLGSLVSVELPSTFAVFLDSILAFSKHPSHVLNNYTLSLWSNFFRHSEISESPPLQKMIPQVVPVVMEKLIKVGYPSKKDSVSSDYSRLDFECDEEFNIFYNRFRNDMVDVLRNMTLLQPEIAFRFGAQWLRSLISEKKSSENTLLQWDGLAQFLEGMTSRLFHSEKPKPTVQEGINLLHELLVYEIQDPMILSSSLSCISALLVFVTMQPGLLPLVLDKIFVAVVFSLPGQTKSTRTKSVRNVRMHACSSLVKICKQNSKLILPAFDHIYNHVKLLSKDPEQLSKMEKGTLHEALILICNEFQEYEKQFNFLGEIITPVSALWLSDEIRSVLSSSEHVFMAHIGLDQPPVEPSREDTAGINRSQLISCINMIMGIIKRSMRPDDSDAARRGGFVCPHTGNESSEYLRNPATPHVVPLLHGVLSLIRVLNSLYIPSIRERIYSTYAPSLDMTEFDKSNILGPSVSPMDLGDSSGRKTSVEKMRHFLATIHENCCHILGSAAQNLGFEFYAIPGLPELIESCAFAHLEHLPDYKLRPILRCFVKPFIHCCPTSYYDVIISILGGLCPFMYQKLSSRWENFKKKYGTSIGYEDEMTETQEVLEDQLNRQLTREYIDLLGSLMQNRKFSDTIMDAMEDETEQKPFAQSENISELGKIILKTPSLCPIITFTFFNAIHWLDTTTSLKSLQVCVPIFKYLFEARLIHDEREVSYLLQNALLGLHELGEHDANQGLLIGLSLLIYESTRPHFPGISNILSDFVGCKSQDIQSFDEKLLSTGGSKQMNEKRKRDLFKKLISEIIGKHLGQQFKCDIKIKNLPPPFLPPRPKNFSLEDIDDGSILCSVFDYDLNNSECEQNKICD